MSWHFAKLTGINVGRPENGPFGAQICHCRDAAGRKYEMCCLRHITLSSMGGLRRVVIERSKWDKRSGKEVDELFERLRKGAGKSDLEIVIELET